VPLVGWVAVYFNQKMTHTYTELFENLGHFNARVEDNVGGSGDALHLMRPTSVLWENPVVRSHFEREVVSEDGWVITSRSGL